MSTYTKYSLNKLEIKNELSNFGEQAKKIWNSGLGVKHQNQIFMLKIIPTPLLCTLRKVSVSVSFWFIFIKCYTRSIIW